MIINITYPDKKTARAIESIVGKSFTLMERFKMKGIGCAKLQIMESSNEIQKLISANRDTAYCNIELKQEGIVLGFNSTGRIYAWCIPYYRLHIYYNSGQLSIYGPQNHIKAAPPFNGTVDKNFLRKVLRLKAEATGDNPF